LEGVRDPCGSSARAKVRECKAGASGKDSNNCFNEKNQLKVSVIKKRNANILRAAMLTGRQSGIRGRFFHS
jgi:ribosome modulation factor